MTERPIIAIDCDEVLVPTAEYFVDAYNDQYGTEVDFQTQHLEDPTGSWQASGFDELLERLEAIRDTEAYRALGISDEARVVLARLATNYDLHLVTARQPHEEDDTRHMLERDAQGLFRGVHFVGFEGSKGQIVKELGARMLIDDSPRHLEDGLANGLPGDGAILFGEFPWNRQDPSDDRIVRMESWSAVEGYVNGIQEAEIERIASN